MTTFPAEIAYVFQKFIAEISSLAQRATFDALESAFTQRLLPDSVGPGRSRLKLGRGKRTAAALTTLSERFNAFVKTNPGLRIEQINMQLGTTTSELALPIRKLIAEGAISTKGQKRSTTYFPGRRGRN